METLTKPAKQTKTVKKSSTATKPSIATILSRPAAKPKTDGQAKTKAKPRVQSFRDLGTWQLSRELAVAVYRQCELFPQHATSVLACQMTQASMSVCSNIAESFSRKGEERERLFSNAAAALTRLDNYTLIAHELGFLAKGQADDLDRRSGLTRWTLLKLQKMNREWMERG